MSLLIKLSLISLVTFGLVGCSSVQDTPNQIIEILTPGAQNARCDVHVGRLAYQAYPPQRISVQKTGEMMTVNCFAPGYRERTITVEAEASKNSFGHVLTRGVGSSYDFSSAVMPTYPDQIAVDFTRIFPKVTMTPHYRASAGAVSQYEQGVELIRGGSSTVDLRAGKAWISERERRKSSVGFAEAGKGTSVPSHDVYKGYQGSDEIPALVSPYFPQSNFQGSTSF